MIPPFPTVSTGFGCRNRGVRAWPRALRRNDRAAKEGRTVDDDLLPVPQIALAVTIRAEWITRSVTGRLQCQH
jgi:hypothetical protein